MDELYKQLQMDIWTLQIEADFAADQPESRELQQRFADIAERVDHRLERVAGLLQQQEAEQEASV